MNAEMEKEKVMNNLRVNADKDKDDISTRRSSSNRPSGLPRSDRDFRKVLDNRDSERNPEDDEYQNAKGPTALNDGMGYEEVAYEQEDPKQQSLFDLSRKSFSKNEELAQENDTAKMVSSDELPTESQSSIIKNLALKEKAQSKNAKLAGAGEKMGDDEEESSTVSRFPQERIDLSSVNPQASNQQTAFEISNDPQLDKSMSSQKMTTQQLVDAIVKAVAVVENSGKTDTVVTLKNPPLFAGANLVLTSFDYAKGEFNIRFENMSQQGKSFMDMQQNQNSLRFALQEKGYAVHIMVVTTEIETPKFVAEAQQSQQRNPEDQQQDQPKKRRQDEEEA